MGLRRCLGVSLATAEGAFDLASVVGLYDVDFTRTHGTHVYKLGARMYMYA